MQTYSSALWRTIFSFSRAERSKEKEINRIDAAAHYWSLAKGCFSSSFSFQGFPLWTVWAARLIYAHIFICISSCRVVLMFIELWFICTLGLHSVADWAMFNFSCSLSAVSVSSFGLDSVADWAMFNFVCSLSPVSVASFGLDSVAHWSKFQLLIELLRQDTELLIELQCNDWCPTRYNPFFHYLIL